MADFYVDTLNKLLRQGVLATDHKLLVVCGGDYDRQALVECGFRNVTISNVDCHDAQRYFPYHWSRLDAEDIACGDNEYDVCLAHSGLHHCQSPHRALLEMYRVARLGVIVFEPLDNAATRLGVRLGLGQDYEIAAVAGNDCAFGGLRNTPIPNYVYRWTPREIEKTVQSYAPVGSHRFLYFYAMRLNWARAESTKSRLLRGAFRVLRPCASLFSLLFPRQSNNFGFMVLKPRLPEDVHPWLQWGDERLALNIPWVLERYCEGVRQGQESLLPREGGRV